MSEEDYNWQRYWYPRGTAPKFINDAYIVGMEHYRNEPLPFTSLEHIPCLVNLGEPGSGKSRCLKVESEVMQLNAEAQGDSTLYFDLKPYSSDLMLVRDLFESEQFRVWESGTHRLYLYLDSTDESLLHVNTLASLLPSQFAKYRLDRLNLRIACRTMDWPTSLEEGLKTLWGQDKVHVYELAALREEDIRAAAMEKGVDPDHFIREVDKVNVRILAGKPVTLKMLLNIFNRDKFLPQPQYEVYEQGCMALCDELSPSYRSSGLAEKVSVDRRMAVAGRIAAAMIFGKRAAIWKEEDLGEAGGDELTIREICGGYEMAGETRFEVTPTDIRDALRTGLFSSLDTIRAVWSHQTYCEFLSCWYLEKGQVPASTILSILIHPGDPEHRLVPQLRETAAWVAGRMKEVAHAIIRSEPEVLLRSDVATASSVEREELVCELLAGYDEERILNTNYGIGAYEKLRHNKLAGQLRLYIQDKTKSVNARRVAIQIAEVTETRDLLDDLVNLALDSSEPLDLRVYAVTYIATLGDTATKLRMKALAQGDSLSDRYGRLQGWALRALWPSVITTEEMLSMLTSPSANAASAYGHFLSTDIPTNLRANDLPVALTWVARRSSFHRLSYFMRNLVNKIMKKGWENLEEVGVLDAFADVVVSRLRNHDSVWDERDDPIAFQKSVESEHWKRRSALEAVLSKLDKSDLTSFWRLYSGNPLLSRVDVPWMLERLQLSESRQMEYAWAMAIQTVFDKDGREHYEELFTAYRTNKVLHGMLGWAFEPVMLDSPDVEKLKEQYEFFRPQVAGNNSEAIAGPPLAEEIEDLLSKCEAGSPQAWVRLYRVMMLSPDRRMALDVFESNMMLFPGWNNAREATRQRIIEAAKTYVLIGEPKVQEQQGSDNHKYSAFASYAALRLLLNQEPSFLVNLEKEKWSKWAATIFFFPIIGGANDEEDTPHRKLTQLAYMYAPAQITSALISSIDAENASSGYAIVHRKIDDCYDARLSHVVLQQLKRPEMKSGSIRNLLEWLLKRDVEGAREFCASLINSLRSVDEEGREKAVVAAQELMRNAPDAGLPIVWPAIEADHDFGREVISGVATMFSDSYEGSTKIGERLADRDLARLYEWLIHEYPPSEDPDDGGIHMVGDRERIAMWRDNLLEQLVVRGTQNACEEIERIYRQFPDLNYLKRSLSRVQAALRRNSWVPLNPRQIIRLAKDREARLVQNGEQLIEVIIESLDKLEAKLQGETPAAEFLWNVLNTNSAKVYRPKEENSISNFIKLHLEDSIKQKGVIVNREVEIRSSTRRGGGERVDILVDAVTAAPHVETFDTITVIIEVKGCWHPDLDTAIETQLANRYMRDHLCQDGLYLVSWFDKEHWDISDDRRRSAPRGTLEETKGRLEARAHELSQGGRSVSVYVLNASLR